VKHTIEGEAREGDVVRAGENADLLLKPRRAAGRAGTHATHSKSLTAEVPSLEDQPP